MTDLLCASASPRLRVEVELQLGDYAFAPEWDIISSMDKARRLGFDARVDTREMFARLIEGYRGDRVVP